MSGQEEPANDKDLLRMYLAEIGRFPLLKADDEIGLARAAEAGERRAAWYWLSFLLYVAGFLANEGGVVIGAVLLVYYAMASLYKRRDVLDFTMKMLPFGIAATLLVSGLSGCGCQGVEGGFYGIGWHIPRETWVYMSRLAYPVGAIPLEPSGLEWGIGSAVAAVCIFFLIRGPNVARWAAVGLVMGLMPYVPGKIWTATRYTYMSVPLIFFMVSNHFPTVYGSDSAWIIAVVFVIVGWGITKFLYNKAATPAPAQY